MGGAGDNRVRARVRLELGVRVRVRDRIRVRDRVRDRVRVSSVHSLRPSASPVLSCLIGIGLG